MCVCAAILTTKPHPHPRPIGVYTLRNISCGSEYCLWECYNKTSPITTDAPSPSTKDPFVCLADPPQCCELGRTWNVSLTSAFCMFKENVVEFVSSHTVKHSSVGQYLYIVSHDCDFTYCEVSLYAVHSYWKHYQTTTKVSNSFNNHSNTYNLSSKLSTLCNLYNKLSALCNLCNKLSCNLHVAACCCVGDCHCRECRSGGCGGSDCPSLQKEE